jgi:hypothetical protein
MDDDSKATETQTPSDPLPEQGNTGEPAVDLWAVSYSDEDDRELTFDEVASAIKRGEINGATIVWRPGMADWVPLAQTPDFAALLQQRTAADPEPKPKPPSPAPVRVSSPDLEMLDADFRPQRARYVLPAGLIAAAAAGLVLWGLVESAPESATTAGPSPPEARPAPASPHQNGAAPAANEPAGGSAPKLTLSDFEHDAPKANLQPFNRFAALKTMGVAAYKAIRCRGRGTPAGVAYVTVTFQSDGTISSARIYQAPYAGTPTATCILTKLRGTTIAPFKGPAVTMRIPVELH